MNSENNNLFSFPEVRVVEASAGSGKTYALAKRYVQLLINPSLKQSDIPLRNILAITFTNKASVEMKERILEFLKKTALNSFSNKDEEKDILSSFGVSKEAAQHKAFAVMDYIIRNYNFFQVQTIDSFVNAVVSSCAYKLNLSSKFNLKKTGHTDYLTHSLDMLIEKSVNDKFVTAVFKDFIMRFLYIENKTGWFPKKNILHLLENLYFCANTYGNNFKKAEDGSTDNLLMLKKDIIDKILQLQNKLPDGTNKIFEKSLSSFLSGRKESFSIEELSKYFSYEMFPINKGKQVSDEIKALWDTIRFDISFLARREAYSFFNCYIDIFNMASSDFHALSVKDDVLFLSELNKQASDLFARGDTPVPEIYYRLATRFKHFMIDEFQDTSSLQWKNLLPMIEELLASGGSLFYVGDKKQAIYRFRGGDASLFDTVPVYFSQFNPKFEILGKNYRSHKEIVEFNNNLFSSSNLNRFINSLQEENKDNEIALSGSDVSEVLKVFEDSKQDYKPENINGYVKIQHLEAVNNEERDTSMEAVIKWLVMDLKERFAYKDIAILARNNNEIELITGWLLENKIPVESEKTLNVRENIIIKEIMSFLIFLNSPIDDLAFVSFVTGSIFAKASGISRQELNNFIFNLNKHKKERNSNYIYKQFRDSYQAAWDNLIDEFFVNVGFVPLYELVISILSKFNVLNNFQEHQAFIMRFLELIKSQENDNFSIASFIEYFNTADDTDLFVAVTDTDSVKLLTIHKSKGLEFPAVIIPFLSMKLKASPAGSGYGSFDISQNDEGISLVRLNKAYIRYCPELKKLYIEKYKKALVDELNTIYVALTRAKCELYAYIPAKSSGSKNPAANLIPENVENGSQINYTFTKKQNSFSLYDIPVVTYGDWIELLKDEFKGSLDINRAENIMRGDVLHYALSLIDNLYNRDKVNELNQSLAKTQAAYRSYKNFNEIEATIIKLLGIEELKEFFYVEDGIVYREKEIIISNGAVKRIDRLIVRENHVQVVDYKSSKSDADNYKKQVNEYMNLIKEIYPGRKVTGHILYFDTFSMEKIENE